MGVQKPALFFRGYLNKKLYCGANNAYNINETLIKNDINTIIIDFNTKNEIHHLVPVLLNNSPTKKYKLEIPPITKQSIS